MDQFLTCASFGTRRFLKMNMDKNAYVDLLYQHLDLHLKRMASTMGPSYSVSFGVFKNLFEEQEAQAWETISHFASLLSPAFYLPVPPQVVKEDLVVSRVLSPLVVKEDLTLIWRRGASFGDPLRLERALSIEEGFPDLGVQAISTQNWFGRRIGALLGLAKESFFGNLISSSNFTQANRNLTATFAAVKIQSWRQKMVPLTPVGGNMRGAHAREDEQRREERGLVQAMQTQAHTQDALQAQLEAQALAPVPQGHDHGGPSIME
ncbi:hypothetical protein Taro_045436 [Colocasia esculenta]|uniref:Uncharacterized protein n=1 Tax=Colocasia esculenta TaxID=4460 RepID=A0A843X474_COLES|nr:hypothetical protein [Colocasia esculenta]